MENTSLNTVIKQNFKLFKTYLFAILIFFIFRLVYFFRFGNFSLTSSNTADLFEAFYIGFRFDTMILLYAFFLVFIINFLFFIKNKKFEIILNKFTNYLLVIILLILFLILIIDQQYYTYFQYHINIMVYGLFEDDTQAVMKSVWTDHPIFVISIVYMSLIFITVKVINKIYANSFYLRFNHKYKNIIFLLVYTLIYPVITRGSLGEFPLNLEDSTISKNKFINQLSQNAFLTLESAIKEHAKSRKKLTNKELLAKYRYTSINQALSDYYQMPVDSFKNGNYTDYLFKTTKKDTFLKENPPNVVFILAESFGNYYLNFHSKELILLGSFEKHINNDLFYRNFLSSTRGTIFSLESIVLSKEYPSLTDTKERFYSYESSVAYPFSESDYETIFITGSKLAWRNLHELMPSQFFSQVYGKAVIMRNIDNAKTSTWGVYDEFLFDEIYNELKRPSDKPKLIVALTTSNHTPYEIPDNYEPYPIKIHDSIKEIIIANKDIAQLSFQSYQYMNDKFGKMLDKIKASDLGGNTIVGYSGDHNSYTLFPYERDDIDPIYTHSVPFYLYVPEKYLKNAENNTKRYGSHKDIFPTLINLALSEQKYFSLGNDLLDETVPDSLFYGINNALSIGPKNMSAKTLNAKVKARKALSEYYFNSIRIENELKLGK